MRDPGPRRLHLGRNRRRPLPLRRPAVPQVRPRDGLPRLRIYQLHETVERPALRRDRRWASRATAGRFVVLGEKEGLGIFAVGTRASRPTRADTVYVGTDRGPLRRARDDRFQFDKEANSVGSGPVTAVHVDPRGVLYFSRSGLLFRKESGRAVEFGRPRGLPADETLDDVQTDAAGRLWVRTVKHLYVLPAGLAALRARRRGAAGVERGRTAGPRRPRRAPRSDGAGPRRARRSGSGG